MNVHKNIWTVENYVQKHASGAYTESLQQTILHNEKWKQNTLDGILETANSSWCDTTTAEVNNAGYSNFCQLQQWHLQTPVLFVGVHEKHTESSFRRDHVHLLNTWGLCTFHIFSAHRTQCVISFNGS